MKKITGGKTVKLFLEDLYSPLQSKLVTKAVSCSNPKIDEQRAYIAAVFPPVEVGNKAPMEGTNLFEGDKHPQFTVNSHKKLFLCEMCPAYWGSLKGTDKKIREKCLEFQGPRQAYEHYISCNHQSALSWMASRVQIDDCIGMEKTADTPTREETRGKITSWVKFTPVSKNSHLN